MEGCLLMDPKAVEKLEAKIEEAIAEVIAGWASRSCRSCLPAVPCT